ncbi:MAG: FMN-binding negative transcriptional regulator, partial [Pseudomonadota bacterium]|nr:FMN-binding negative transcriptional regulator [Pseudomonadota bacterium]
PPRQGAAQGEARRAPQPGPRLMHPNRRFHMAEREAMAAFVRDQGFGLLVAQTPEGLRAVHVPVLIEGERLRFHVSKGNLVHDALMGEADALFVATGAHGYISPDWYGQDDRVPTWNYVAVELEGPVRPIDPEALSDFLDALSDHHEAHLAPKPVWRRDKMSPGRFEGLLKAITGFELEIGAWRGTSKLDQDKPPEVLARLCEALDARGEAALAEAMRP